MLIQMGNANQVEATADVKKQMQSHARSFSTSDVLRMMKAFNSAATDLRGGWQPSLSLELALAEVLDAPNESTPIPTALRQTKAQPVPVSQTESKLPPSPLPQENRDDVSGESSSPQDVQKRNTQAQGSRSMVEVDEPRPLDKAAVGAEDIIRAWKHLSASLPKTQANLSALLNSVRMIDMQGKTLILGLASDVLVSKIDKPDQIEVVRKLIKDQFGVDVNIRCVVMTAKGKIPPNVPQDGMVATAIQHGGEIVDRQD